MEETRHTRKSFLSGVALPAAAAGILPALLPFAGCGREFTGNPGLPNIIFITADNLGWHDLSCYGNRKISTPGTDRLATEGVRFTRAFVTSSSCSPSRASFLTGQYPHTCGVTALTHLKKAKALSPFSNTLPKLLRKAGYNTALQGKWHVSPYLPVSWYGFNERLSGMLPKDWHIRDLKKTREFLNRNRKNRFYLQMNFINSHRDPYGEYQFDPDFPVDPEDVRVPQYMAMPDWPEIREDLARYYSQNLRMEKLITELLVFLDETGLAGNTLVLFTSDNGPHYPGMISALYDRGVAVPLIARLPGRIRPGRTSANMISGVDIAPTLLEAAGVPVPADMQGRSFLETLSSGRSGPRRDAVYLEIDEHVRYIPTRAVRTDRWKYIRNYSDNPIGLDQNNHMDWAHRMCELPGHPWKRPRPEEELYDLKTDPQEQKNLAKNPRFSKTLTEMRMLLRTHMKETRDPWLGRPFTRDFDPGAYQRDPAGHRYW